jgi:non-specific serine/threonine protein kinase
MLETIRELAIEHHAESGDADDLRQRHTTYFLELAELAQPELDAASSSIWFDRLEAEHDNLRAALADTLEHGRADLALRLGHAVHTFWFARGCWGEGRRWLASALAGTTDPHLRAAALPGAGVLAIWQGDVESGRAVSEELLALAEEIGSTRARADGLLIAGIVTDDPDEEVRLDTEAAQLARELGDWALVGHCANNIGNVELGRGNYERALGLFEESLAAGRELNNQDLIARASTNLGLTTLLLGDLEGARLPLRDGLNAARKLGQIDGLVYGFVGLAATYAREDPLLATRLLGRADAMCEETAYNLEPLESGVRDQTRAQLRANLGEDGYAAGCEEGRALTLQDALALILRPD